MNKKKSKQTLLFVAATTDSQINKIAWTEKMLEIYLDICITEIHVGNHPGTYFNKTGWKNMINKFNEKIRKQYCYKQLKNKWDCLKKE